jgi:hypothetical protein
VRYTLPKNLHSSHRSSRLLHQLVIVMWVSQLICRSPYQRHCRLLCRPTISLRHPLSLCRTPRLPRSFTTSFLMHLRAKYPLRLRLRRLRCPQFLFNAFLRHAESVSGTWMTWITPTITHARRHRNAHLGRRLHRMQSASNRKNIDAQSSRSAA